MEQSSNSWDPPAPQQAISTAPQHRQGGSANGKQRQRKIFWAAAAFAWAVWALAVIAAAHDEWLVVDGRDEGGFDVGNETFLYFCDNGLDNEYGRFCNLYRGFTATQFAATVTCSIAVALLVLAAFRPAVAGCASAKSLGTAGGILLITYAVFQLATEVLAFFVEREWEDAFNELAGTSGDDVSGLGLTFWVGFAGLVLALLTAACLVAMASYAGDGPFYGTGRVWVASGLAWVVWGLAVTATAHDEWLLFSAEDIPLGDVEIRPGQSCGILDELDYDDDQANEYDLICDYHRAFTATQFAATAICSVAVALLALAAFRPAVAGCGSVKSLSIAGGVLLMVYVAVQIGAGVMAHLVGNEWERIYNEVLQNTTSFEVDFGPMFWVVVCGAVLAMVASCSLLANAKKNAENGPLYGGACCVIESGAPARQREEEKTVQAWESA